MKVYDVDWDSDVYLAHHGVKGMKWGVRRYQNVDGTLTSEGKSKYGTVENFVAAQKAKKEKRKQFIRKAAPIALTGAYIGTKAIARSQATKRYRKAIDKVLSDMVNVKIPDAVSNSSFGWNHNISADDVRRTVKHMQLNRMTMSDLSKLDLY